MKSIFKIIVVVLLLPAVLFALGANTENGMVITDTRDTIDEILEEVEEVEHHVHNQNKVFGQAASAPLIMTRESVTALTVEGGNNAFGTSKLLHKGTMDGAYYDPDIIYVSAVDTANSPTLVELYHGVLGGSVAYTGEADDNIITAAGHGLSDGNILILDTLNDETYGVTTNIVYYARDVSGSTFKVALTSGGSEINITTDISGNLKKISSSTLSSEIIVSFASTSTDAAPIMVTSPRIPSTEAYYARAKSKAGDTTLISFFVGLHTYVQ